MAKRVLITGAASGLGWELTQQYGQLGWHVILLDRDESLLSQRSEQLQTPHQTIVADLTECDSLARSIAAAIAEPLELLINNAGITHRSQASLTDPAVFSKVMAVNWLAPVQLTRLCLPALRRCCGGVVCISSMAAKMPVPGRAAYCASKAALAQHFETWRPELKQEGIDLLMVYPSFLNTAIEQNALGSDGARTTRPRSIVGAVQNAGQMAQLIIKSQQSGRQRLYTPQWSSRFGAWLWVQSPWLFQMLSWKKFAAELDVSDSRD